MRKNLLGEQLLRMKGKETEEVGGAKRERGKVGGPGRRVLGCSHKSSSAKLKGSP